jgi:septum formation protein
MSWWRNLDRPLILASQSARRKEILTRMGLTFAVVPPNIDSEEEWLQEGDLPASIERLAMAKASVVAAGRDAALVLAADTIVVCDNVLLGKPRDDADAIGMLARLSGRAHRVYTGVALICPEEGFSVSATAVTIVRFRTIGRDDINAYLSAGEHRDKAGAYGIQGAAMVFVESIDGCYYNVVGLPVSAVIDLLTRYVNRKDRGNA